MKNWQKPPDFRGLFPDQPGFANELLKDYVSAEHGFPTTKEADSLERDEEGQGEVNPYGPAREKLHLVIAKYLEENDLTSPAFSDVQASLASLGRVFYSRRGYHGLRTLFSRWTSETIERDLLASKSFIEPLFMVHSPEKYALAHREARNNLRHFSKYILNHLSQDHLELLTDIGELDRTLKKAAGFTIDTLVSIDSCIHNALTGKPFPEQENDESYLIAQSYLLDFIRDWKRRPNIEKIMVAMESAKERITSAINNEPPPERVLFFLATKIVQK